MRINQLRKDVKELIQPILLSYGFLKIGELGEYLKTEESGNIQAILIE